MLEGFIIEKLVKVVVVLHVLFLSYHSRLAKFYLLKVWTGDWISVLSGGLVRVVTSSLLHSLLGDAKK